MSDLTEVRTRSDLETLLASEYELLYGRIGKFNETIHTMRGWLLTAFAALGLFGGARFSIVLFMLAFTLGTWISEGYVRAAQQRLYPRIEAIESYFRGESPTFPYQARTQALELAYSIGGFVHATRMMRHIESYSFYLVFVLAAVLLSLIPAEPASGFKIFD